MPHHTKVSWALPRTKQADVPPIMFRVDPERSQYVVALRFPWEEKRPGYVLVLRKLPHERTVSAFLTDSKQEVLEWKMTNAPFASFRRLQDRVDFPWHEPKMVAQVAQMTQDALFAMPEQPVGRFLRSIP